MMIGGISATAAVGVRDGLEIVETGRRCGVGLGGGGGLDDVEAYRSTVGPVIVDDLDALISQVSGEAAAPTPRPSADPHAGP